MGYSRAKAFTATTKWIVPAGVFLIHFTGIGGGGGGAGTYQSLGGGGGEGGSSGELCVRFPVRVTPGETIIITVGNGGPLANFWSADAGGTIGGDTSFGGRAQALGGRRGIGGGIRGGVSGISSSKDGKLGTLAAPCHMGGTGGAYQGSPGGTPTAGTDGTGSMGRAVGGIGGIGFASEGGGAGGAASVWGIGGEGGRGSGLGGHSHGPEGDSGAHPGIVNGNPAPEDSYGAGGGGAGGPNSSYSSKMNWGGPGAKGYALVEWVQPYA